MTKRGRAPEGARAVGIHDHLRQITLADVLDGRVAALALALAWQFVVFFSATIHFSTRNDVTHFNSVVGFSSLGAIMVFLLAAAAPRAVARLSAFGAGRWLAALLMVGCTAVLAVVDMGTVIQQPWCSIASTLAGCGVALLYLALGDVLCRLTVLQVMAKMCSALTLAALLMALIVLLPRPVGVAVTALLPIAVGLLLFGRAGTQRPVDASGEDAETAASTATGDGAADQRRGRVVSVRAVLSAGVLACAASFARAFLLDASPIINDGTYPWLFLIATLVAVALVCGPLLSSASVDFAAAYKVVVFALGFVFLLIPLMQLDSVAADVLGLLTYCAILLLMWVVLARLASLYRLNPFFTFGIGWATYTAGLLAGTFAGALVTSYLDVTPRLLSAVALLCVCLIFFAYLFLFTEKSMARALGGPSAAVRRPFRDRCRSVASEFGLTSREEEIMELVAKGRSTPRIREELGLTAGTVNAHMSHLYRKLDVHDRQEIIDLVEAERVAG